MESVRVDEYSSLGEVARTQWGLHHWLSRIPSKQGTTLEERVALLENEKAVRDTLARYVFFYDGRDLDGVMSVFHDDCLLVNRFGTWQGKDAVRRYYEAVIPKFTVNYHLLHNVLVRFTNDPADSAWVASYFGGLNVGSSGKLAGALGMYADRLVNVDGEWKFIERRISGHLLYDLPRLAFPPTMAGGPQPTSPETTDEWVKNW